MDDNYSSELAALERLAHAEEVDRQRVMSKLDVWKAALADYDAKMASVDEEYGYWSSRNAAAFAPDYLRVLLAVAEAAAEYKRDGGYEPMAKLFDALKALE